MQSKWILMPKYYINTDTQVIHYKLYKHETYSYSVFGALSWPVVQIQNSDSLFTGLKQLEAEYNKTQSLSESLDPRLAFQLATDHKFHLGLV